MSVLRHLAGGGGRAVQRLRRAAQELAAEDVGPHAFGHAAHRPVVRSRHRAVVHAWHPTVRGRPSCSEQLGEDSVWRPPRPVHPVVEDDDPLLVVVPRIGRILDDQNTVEAAVELHS